MWEDLTIPLATNMIQEFARWLLPMYQDGETLELKLDLDNVPALADRRKAKFETANTATFMTINEKRELVGLEPSPEDGADKIWMPSGLMPLDEMEDPDDGMEEGEDDDVGVEDEEGEEGEEETRDRNTEEDEPSEDEDE
jgi:hypothetical protein